MNDTTTKAMKCDWCNEPYSGGGYWVGRENICSQECLLERTSLPAPDPEPNPLPRKEVISIQPGDKIVLSVEYALSKAAHERIKETLELEFPNTKAMILDAGMTLEVYREQGKEIADYRQPDDMGIITKHEQEAHREQGKRVEEPEYYCTQLKRKCWGSCEINPSSAKCSHREQVKDESI